MLHVLHPAVYRPAGVPSTWEQRVHAAVLAAGPGAVASHRSAARVWRLDPGDWRDVEITVPRRNRPRLGRQVVVHRSRDLEDALDRALAARLVSVAAVERAYGDLARPGRSGCGAIRRVLDRRVLGSDPPDGLLEPRMARLLRDPACRRPPSSTAWAVSGASTSRTPASGS